MEIVAFLAPWILVGIAVVYLAFRGEPGSRPRRRGSGGHMLRLVLTPLFLVLAVVIPGLVIADNGPARGGLGSSASASLTEQDKRGRELFLQTCASCHKLEAVNARGITGPSLDELGAIDAQRVENAIELGGSGEKRMPAGLLEGENAAAVAAYVAKTAGG